MALLLSVSLPIMSAASGSTHALARSSDDQKTKSIASPELQQFAKQNITKLSKLDSFSSWRDAEYHIEPLGPGTHSWLVSITKKEMTPSPFLGYMVISVTSSGQYVLVEYGAGEDSIYHPDKLYEALSTLNKSSDQVLATAQPYYGGPLWTEWKIAEDEFIHAFTGEILPQTSRDWANIAQSYTPPSKAVTSSVNPSIVPEPTITTGSSFDPYDQISWMTAKPLSLKAGTFISSLVDKEQLVYVSAEANRSYNLPLPISGYQKWDANIVYIQVGSTTSPRFVALDSLFSAGHFKTNRSDSEL